MKETKGISAAAKKGEEQEKAETKKRKDRLERKRNVTHVNCGRLYKPLAERGHKIRAIGQALHVSLSFQSVL